jgi:hypothetical protein
MHLACIHCGSINLERYRSPRQKGRWLFRRHRCQECKRISLSVHGIVSDAVAEDLLAGFGEPPPTQTSI